MPTMNINLPEDLAQFVADQLRSGGYSNQSEIVREGLRLLRRRSDKLRALRDRFDSMLADVEAE